jgi:hypothetical protein
VEISGADSFANRSSNALDDNLDPLFFDAADPATRLPADNDGGYVATFEAIDPGSDGEIEVTIYWDGSDPLSAYKGKYASAFRLVYLPEPSEFWMLAAGIAFVVTVGRGRIKWGR